MTRWLRRTLLVAACGLGLAGWGASLVRAQLAAHLSAVIEVARGIAPGAQRLWVNGLSFDVQSGTDPRPSSEVLDAFDAHCARLDAGLHTRAGDVWPGAPRPGAFRLDAGIAGFVACLELDRESWSWEELTERLAEFADSGDLAALGQVRIARVTPAGEGAHWVSVVSRGPLPFVRAFPPKGDAPGADLPDVPRPRAGRRILSVRAHGRAERLVSYELEPSADLAPWLEAWRAAGWTLTPEPLERDSGRLRAWRASRGGVAMVAMAARSGQAWILSVARGGDTFSH